MMNNIPQQDLEILISHAINKSKEFLFAHPEFKLSLWQNIRLKYFAFLYRRGYSVAVIIKHKEFFGLDFFVNKNVLIPRPDTELMVENAIEEIKKSNKEITLIDVGTGSGCIPISILKKMDKKITAYGIDISQKSLRVAEKNAINHKVSIKFIKGNLLRPIMNLMTYSKNDFVITANLPYLTEQQFKLEKSIQKEPKLALVAKNNGLALYEELFKQIKFLPGHSITIFLEIDPSQSQKISELAKKYFTSAQLQIKNDLAGRDRLVIVRL